MQRRIGAYGVCRDSAGRLLLVRAGPRSARAGCWLLPGGAVEHGEHPAAAVLRELAEETGLAASVTAVRDVFAEVVDRESGPEHTDGVIYELEITGGELRAELDGSSDLAQWYTVAEARALPLSRFAAAVLRDGAGAPPEPPDPPLAPVGPPAGTPEPVHPTGAPSPDRRGQRFAVYGLATDPAGRLLLTRIAEGYPGAGRWHLPGGGTDAGEQPRAALARELAEETGQQGRIEDLLLVSSWRNPAALGPEGHPLDWHGVRAVFRLAVEQPTVPWVMDTGGSTAEAAWFSREEAAGLPLTELARTLLTNY